MKGPLPSSRPPTQPQGPDRLIIALLVLLTLTTFAGVAQCGFINLDDDVYVTGNPRVFEGLGLQGVAWAFTTFHAANYHPLTWLSLMLDAELSEFLAPPGRPAFVFHMTNLALHTLNAVLVFAVLRRMTGAAWRAALAAAVFAVHPLRVESVAWVAERKDVLSACFGLLAMLAYVRYTRTRRWREYALVAAMFALSLLSKPMLVTLPLLFLLLDFWPLGRTPWLSHRPAGPSAAKAAEPAGATPKAERLIVEKLPLLALSAASCVVTFIAQRSGGAVQSIENLGLSARLGNVPVAYARYLGKMLWFGDLAVFYPFNRPWPAWQVGCAAVLLAGVSALALARVKASPWLAVGWCWFLGLLVPVIGLVQAGVQSMADRYSYLPSVGLLVMAVWSLPELKGTKPESPRPRALLVCWSVAFAGILASLSFFTAKQTDHWRDSVFLLDHAVRVTQNNWFAENNLGSALIEAHREQEAVAHFRRSRDIRPELAVTHSNYGMALARAGDSEGATKAFEKALAIDPDLADAHHRLGVLLAKAGRPDEAIDRFRRALRRRPDDFHIQHDLGMALADKGDWPAAIEQYKRAIAGWPYHAEAHFHLGKALVQVGLKEEAMDHFRKAVEYRPDEARYREAMEAALAGSGAGPTRP
ncbi:MAG: tetratricopeptide repeat protein [Planctomycetota bacterium]|nr:tetratricopeptide repeat protein [Planctomycetota bacterium]